LSVVTVTLIHKVMHSLAGDYLHTTLIRQKLLTLYSYEIHSVIVKYR